MNKNIRKIYIGVFAFAMACQSTPTYEKYSDSNPLAGFDTVYAYTEYAKSQEDFKAHFDKGVELFRYYSDFFDIYNEYSNINNLMTINKNAGKQPVEVDQEIIDMLQMAKEFYEYSNGEFDITMGALMQVWHRYRDEGIEKNLNGELGDLPSDEELEEAYACKGWDKVIIDDEKNTVYLTEPCMALDVGGIAKGYAAEKIAQQLIEDGTEIATVNAGRNLRTIGVKQDGNPWRMGIADPEGASDQSLIIVDAKEPSSFVTSGDYERFYYASDKKAYSHIIDPTTKYPATLYRSVTIITKDSGVADCLSTTLFTMSVEDGLALIDKYQKDTNEAVEVIWIMNKDSSQDVPNKTTKNNYIIGYTDGLKDAISFDV